MAQRVPGETPLRGAAGIAAIICICACVYNLSKFKIEIHRIFQYLNINMYINRYIPI